MTKTQINKDENLIAHCAKDSFFNRKYGKKVNEE